MPCSYGGLDPQILEDLKAIKPATAFDVGVGYGKSGKLIKTANPDCALTGFEVCQNYEPNIPPGIYGHIIFKDFSQWCLEEQNVDWAVELVFLGDVIEHLPQSRGWDVLSLINYRAKWIILTTPELYLQNTEYNNRHEAHISRWLLSDLCKLNVVHYIKDLTTNCGCTYYLIRGLI